MQSKERWNVEIKVIVPYNLSDSVWHISERAKLAVRPNKALFLEMKPNFFAHLELMQHLMLIMALLVLSIGSIQYIVDMLVDVFNVLNEVVSPIGFELDMSRIYLSGCKWYGNLSIGAK